jgi:hypothetical protein
LQDSEAAIQVTLVMNIVYYINQGVQKKIGIFRGPKSNGICKIHSKSGQKSEFDHHTLNISVHGPYKFIFKLVYCNIDVLYDGKTPILPDIQCGKNAIHKFTLE